VTISPESAVFGSFFLWRGEFQCSFEKKKCWEQWYLQWPIDTWTWDLFLYTQKLNSLLTLSKKKYLFLILVFSHIKLIQLSEKNIYFSFIYMFDSQIPQIASSSSSVGRMRLWKTTKFVFFVIFLCVNAKWWNEPLKYRLFVYLILQANWRIFVENQH
jgi:hypothetical protein